MEELLISAFNLHKLGKVEEAERIYTQILEKEPNNINALDLLSKIKLDKKDFQATIDINKKILEIDSRNQDALFDIAIAYKNIADFDNAIYFYKKVIDYYPNLIQAYYNLASIYSDLGDMNNAIYYFDKVLEFTPEDKETKYFIAIAYMKNRQYKKGLEYFENRLCRKSAVLTQEHTYPNIMSKAKLWQGEDIKDKTIYTYYEAGFGDVIMFSRYLNLLQEKCKKIIFKPQVQLTELFRENFPNIHVMDYFEPENKLNFDYHIPILSLPYALGLNEDNMFINRKSYLKANKEKVEKYHKNLCI